MARSRKHRWLYRFLLVVGAPLVVFLALELLLRLAGIGHSSDFLRIGTIDNTRYFTNNPQFGKRFFDMRRSRMSPTFAVPAQKGRDVFRVVVLGGSAAMGDPYPSIGVPRIIGTVLRSRYPGRKFEVVNAAMTAINSHVVRVIAVDCMQLQPDAVVIWMGNNEVIGPYGPASAFSLMLHKSSMGIRVSMFARGTRIGQLATRLQDAMVDRGPDLEDAWRGMEMFMQTSLGAEDPRLEEVYTHFDRNLEDIVVTAQQAGAAVVVCTVPVNMRNCAPFGDASGAANQQYRSAQSLDDDRRYEDARVQFERARDGDSLRFRADAMINRIIRDRAARNPGIHLVDGVELFREASMNGIPGHDLFVDHVHPNFRGNFVMAAAICRALEDTLVSGEGSYPTLDECRAALPYTVWDRYRVVDLMYGRMKNPPFTSQSDHESTMRWLSMRRRDLKAANTPSQLSVAIDQYRRASDRRPDDWVLRDHLATLFLDAGRVDEARAEILTALRRYPHSSDLRGRLAATSVLSGDTKAALRELRESNPAVYSDKSAALEALASALFEKGKTADARYLFERALKEDPDRVSLHYHMGRLLISTGAFADAEVHFRSVLSAAPDHAKTHSQLGICLAQLGRREESLRHLRRAVDLSPHDGTRLGNLGAMLAEVGHAEEAVAYLSRAAKLDPDSSDICNNLGYALSRAGRQTDASMWYREALRLTPNSPRIELNLADAFFAVQQIDQAQKVATIALKHAKEQRNPALVGRIRDRLRVYGQDSSPSALK